MKTMRKHWVLITITIAAVLAAAVYFRFFFVFGEGVKSGELNYVVYKGVLFKTYEGKLIQTAIRSKAAGSERRSNCITRSISGRCPGGASRSSSSTASSPSVPRSRE